jgi:hypothetical protein
VTKQEQIKKLGALPLTEQGWIAVIDWLAKAKVADINSVASQGMNRTRQEAIEKLSATLRTPDEATRVGWTDRDDYWRGLTLLKLARDRPRAFLLGAPDGLGTYIEGAKGLLDEDPTQEREGR